MRRNLVRRHPEALRLVVERRLESRQESDEGLWPQVRAALDAAADAALSARDAEGEVLSNEIGRILGVLRGAIATITERLPEIIEASRAKLSERAKELEICVDAERLEAEIALLVERHDVQEEIARLEGHFGRAAELQTANGSVGKELDFLSQEMLREINTIGSKVRDVIVSGNVIDMKVAVEQLREQVQNVE